MKISFAGDLSLGALFENLGKGVSEKIDKGTNPFEHTRELFQKSDLNIVNLECVLSSVSSRQEPYSNILRCPEKYINILKRPDIYKKILQTISIKNFESKEILIKSKILKKLVNEELR